MAPNQSYTLGHNEQGTRDIMNQGTYRDGAFYKARDVMIRDIITLHLLVHRPPPVAFSSFILINGVCRFCEIVWLLSTGPGLFAHFSSLYCRCLYLYMSGDWQKPLKL
jgi:hypothetical protein